MIFHFISHHLLLTAGALVILWAMTHGQHHYRRHRRRGLSIYASLPLPGGFRLGKRFRV